MTELNCIGLIQGVGIKSIENILSQINAYKQREVDVTRNHSIGRRHNDR